MANSLIAIIKDKSRELAVNYAWRYFRPDMGILPAASPLAGSSMRYNSGAKDDVLSWDGLLWKGIRRTSVEKRHLKRIGFKEWGTYKHVPKNHKITTDHRTGEHFIKGILAPTTYRKVMSETKDIQKKIRESFMGIPITQESQVIYSDDKVNKDTSKKKKIVEIEKERPSFFSANLLQKTITPSSDGITTVKPSGLC